MPKTIFYFIAFAFQVLFFSFRLLIFLCISLNKTTRNDDDDNDAMASDLGGAFFFSLFTSLLSLVVYKRAVQMVFAIFVVSRNDLIPLNGEKRKSLV